MAVAGCSEQPRRVAVSGTVLIDGEPLPMGQIRFVPDNGRPATSAIDRDGTFALAQASLSSDPRETGILPGKYRVAISATEVIDEDAGEAESLVPGKYADFRTSELAYEIDGPRDELVIDLTWKGHELESDEKRDSQMQPQQGATSKLEAASEQ